MNDYDFSMAEFLDDAGDYDDGYDDAEDRNAHRLSSGRRWDEEDDLDAPKPQRRRRRKALAA